MFTGDVTLSRQEGSTMHYLVNAHYSTDPASAYHRTAFSVGLAGPIVLTGIAIVHWVTCINKIKIKHLFFRLLNCPRSMSSR